jgi:hypothetical protein
MGTTLKTTNGHTTITTTRDNNELGWPLHMFFLLVFLSNYFFWFLGPYHHGNESGRRTTTTTMMTNSAGTMRWHQLGLMDVFLLLFFYT